MKKVMLLLGLLFLSGPARAGVPYFEGQGGLITSHGSQAVIYGVRGGKQFDSVMSCGGWDTSLGYWAARGLSSNQIKSDGLTIHTLSAEIYRTIPLPYMLMGRIGGGTGYSIPNLDNGASELADNGHSFIFGGGVDCNITDSVSLGVDLKWFFFTTDTHLTTYSSHFETLNTGQQVEILDVAHSNDTVDFNSTIVALNLKWK